MANSNSNDKSLLFSDVFKMILTFLQIDRARLCYVNSILNSQKSYGETFYFSQTTISSWLTRGAPKTQQLLEELLAAIRKIIEDDRKSFGAIYSIDIFSKSLSSVLCNYNIDNVTGILHDIISNDLDETIVKSMKYAYNNRNIYSKQSSCNVEAKTNLNESNKKYSRLVIFDLDGTLIKGIKYSWTLLYQSVGVDTSICKYNKRRFERREITYPEWCAYDCEELKHAGLTKEKAYAATEQNCSLTKNFYTALHMLKDLGFAVAIISGGADSVLYSLIPDADKLFDSNIFINRLNFDNDGNLVSITPTEYDWDDGLRGVKGKNEGLKVLCKKYNIEFNEETKEYTNCVFVGDDDNDFKAMEMAGLKILYYVSSPEDKTFGIGVTGMVRDLPRGVKLVEKNDLLLVVDVIKNHYNLN